MSKLGTSGDGVADADECLVSAGDSAESEGFACRGPTHLNDISLYGQFILTVKAFEERLMPHASRIFVESRLIDRKAQRVTLTHLIWLAAPDPKRPLSFRGLLTATDPLPPVAAMASERQLLSVEQTARRNG